VTLATETSSSVATRLRPAGTPERGLPVGGAILFIALACFWGGLALTRGVEHLNSDQHLNLLLVLKEVDPGLFPTDLIFGGKNVTDEYIPTYIRLLRVAYEITGDLAGGFKLLVLPLNLLYLFGAYYVFHRFSERRWIAVVLAIFASFPTAVPVAGELFGIGPVQVINARSLFTAWFPWLFLAFCAWIGKPARLVVLFLFIGLLANIHPVSGLLLVPMLILTYVLEWRGRWRAWLVGFAMGLAALLGAAPTVWKQLLLLARQGATAAQVGGGQMARLVQERMGPLMYPPYTLSVLPRPAVDALTFGLMAFGILLLVQAWRDRDQGHPFYLRLVGVACLNYVLFPEATLLGLLLLTLFFLPQSATGVPEERLAVYFCLSIFWVTIGGLLLLQFVLRLVDRPVLFAAMLRGVRFAGFAVFLLLAVSIRRVDWRRVRRSAQIACLLLAVIVAVSELRDTARTYLRTRGDAAAADLVAVANWARGETRAEDLFLFDSAAFRVLARRSLAFAMKDGAASIYHGAERSAEWSARRSMLREAGSDPVALLRVGQRVGAQYVVVPARTLGDPRIQTLVRYRNSTFGVLTTRSEEGEVTATPGAPRR